jgi:hypothetical protein
MNKKSEPEFKVTDRRKFTSEGEVRSDVPATEEAEREEQQAAPRPVPVAAAETGAGKQSQPAAQGESEFKTPPAPSATQQQAQEQAYRESAKGIDAQLKRELGGHAAQDFEITFERFIASLYMSALVQLGLVQEQGGAPRLDLIGARQTVDTLGLLQEKTKGNLTPGEENLLQNCLYELRMAYVEVTNAITRGPQPGAAGGVPPVPGRK